MLIARLAFLPAPWGRCRAKRGGRGRREGVTIDISRCNPSVCSQSSQPPSLSGKIYQTCGRLNFANLFNFYMLPARELASPQAMTEGCATWGRWCVAIDVSRCNPSVCSQSSQPPSLSGKIYQTCGRLNFTNLINFYMLPAVAKRH